MTTNAVLIWKFLCQYWWVVSSWLRMSILLDDPAAITLATTPETSTAIMCILTDVGMKDSSKMILLEDTGLDEAVYAG